MTALYDKNIPGYDNLFLVGGYDWTAKIFNKTQDPNFIEIGLAHARAFDNLPHKDDVIACTEWENNFRLICGMECVEIPIRAVEYPSVEFIGINDHTPKELEVPTLFSIESFKESIESAEIPSIDIKQSKRKRSSKK